MVQSARGFYRCSRSRPGDIELVASIQRYRVWLLAISEDKISIGVVEFLPHLVGCVDGMKPLRDFSRGEIVVSGKSEAHASELKAKHEAAAKSSAEKTRGRWSISISSSLSSLDEEHPWVDILQIANIKDRLACSSNEILA